MKRPVSAASSMPKPKSQPEPGACHGARDSRSIAARLEGEPRARRRRSAEEVAGPSPRAETRDAPTRSETQSTGAEERPAMERYTALDLGVRTTTFCEVRNGQVIARATVQSLTGLMQHIGPNT